MQGFLSLADAHLQWLHWATEFAREQPCPPTPMVSSCAAHHRDVVSLYSSCSRVSNVLRYACVCVPCSQQLLCSRSTRSINTKWFVDHADKRDRNAPSGRRFITCVHSASTLLCTHLTLGFLFLSVLLFQAFCFTLCFAVDSLAPPLVCQLAPLDSRCMVSYFRFISSPTSSSLSSSVLRWSCRRAGFSVRAPVVHSHLTWSRRALAPHAPPNRREHALGLETMGKLSSCWTTNT